jgi:hypothetical protein
MKKFLIIGLIVALVLIIVGGAGIVYARVRGVATNTAVTVNTTQNGDKIIRQFGYGPGGMIGGYGPGGMMGERGFGPGMMGRRGTGIARGSGIMHDYMISAFASAVGLTVEQVDTRLANGETLKQIAIAQGTAEADLPALATKVRQAALDKAVANGIITQAQADLMLERMNNSSGQGFGPGLGLDNCPMWDGDESPQP